MQIRKAVALKMEEEEVPKVVAKGKGAVAEKILEIARKHGVPIRRDKPLTEALMALEVGQEIPPELYRAIAEVMAFVYNLKKKP
ncbi:MAG: flagellar biosynthesis protein FlhB [Deferribacteres bacterium]|nr:flagellar biosynthesis protein FlhB [Deferribacteres bacterium]